MRAIGRADLTVRVGCPDRFERDNLLQFGWRNTPLHRNPLLRSSRTIRACASSLATTLPKVLAAAEGEFHGFLTDINRPVHKIFTIVKRSFYIQTRLFTHKQNHRRRSGATNSFWRQRCAT